MNVKEVDYIINWKHNKLMQDAADLATIGIEDESTVTLVRFLGSQCIPTSPLKRPTVIDLPKGIKDFSPLSPALQESNAAQQIAQP